MRRLLVPLLAMTILAASAPAAAAEATGVTKCRERVEGGEPLEFKRPGDVLVGRVSFANLQRYADPDVFATAYNPSTKTYGVKSGTGVRANRNVKLSIAPGQRDIAGLGYDSRRRVAKVGSGASVRFQPCPRRTRAFSYDGIVGGVTGFAGGLALSGPVCLVLEARVRGRAPVRRAISFGMGDSCTQP